MSPREETAKLAEQDSKILQEASEWLHEINWEISACGHDAKIPVEKVRELAPKVIKAMANYI